MVHTEYRKMAVPKKRASKARTRRRKRINATLKMPELVRSNESGAVVVRHRIDRTTGFYRGRQVMQPQVKKSKAKSG